MRPVSVADELRSYLRELVAANDRNQKELAKASGTSQGYLSMILSGKRLGNELMLLERLAKALNVPLSRIVSEAERRDLLRHGRTGQSDSHPEGGANVPAEARVQPIADRDRDKKIAKEIRSLSARLADLATSLVEAGTAERKKTGGHRRDRKAG